MFVLILSGVVGLNLIPYHGNPSALFHLDAIAAQHETPLPQGFIVLDVPAYDGAGYYQNARNMPRILRGAFDQESWHTITQFPPSSYAYQRIFLPVLAWIFAIGQEGALPWTFLLINVLSITLAGVMVFQKKGSSLLAASALAFSPAAMVGLHFSLAEPLFLFLTTLFLLRFQKGEKLEWLDITLLSLIGLTREIGIIFIVLVLGYTILRKQWKSALIAIGGLLIGLGWHGVIYGMFHEIPFFMSTEKSGVIGSAMIELILGKAGGYNALTLSSIPLALFVVVPAVYCSGKILWKTRLKSSFNTLATLGFLLVMLAMPDHIWGSITSIGRVITPIYPLLLLETIDHPSRLGKWLQINILLLGMLAALGLMLSVHPYHLAI
jgi:hypothetical protein